jgi:hypothetical protein
MDDDQIERLLIGFLAVFSAGMGALMAFATYVLSSKLSGGS